MLRGTRWTTMLLAVAGMAVALGGCSSGETILDINRRLTSLDQVSKREPDAIYVVEPPDVIQVEFISDDALTRSVTVRSDGYVTLPHVEDVKVVGLTPVEIRRLLEEMYQKYYKEPRILVTVTGYNSKSLYVYGEVGRQGEVAYTGHQTVSSVIGEVGGVTRRAATSRVEVIRGDPDEPEKFRVDLDELLFEGHTRWDVSLAENDVVRVPPTVLAWVGYQIEAVLFPFTTILSGVASTNLITNND